MLLMVPMIKRFVSFAFLLLAVAIGNAPGTLAATGNWDRNEHVAVRLISAVDGTDGLTEIPLGLEFQMQPGWKIYWRSPGDAGLPPIPDWTASDNVADAAFSWPRPERFSIFGLETFGYTDHVVLPLTVKPETTGAPITVTGAINYLVCSDICIPFDANVSLTLPADTANLSGEAPLINRFASAVPRHPSDVGMTLHKAGLATTGEDQVTLRVAALSDTPFSNPDMIVEGPDGSYFGKPTVTLSDNGRNAVFDLVGGGVGTDDIGATDITLTLLDDGRAAEGFLRPQAGLDGIGDSGRGSLETLLPILLLALLGGLILNLMPCVLPVLSMKLLSVVSHGGGDKRDVRRGFLASAAGIVTAFLILAGSLAALKQSGLAIGWGIQFQQPVFLAAMVLLVTLFAANMLGFFHIRLPGAVSDVAAAAGQGRKGLGGHFITGMFATVLATPCSAPFLGTAVGFGLSQGVFEIFAVFVALGIGLSAPYLLVALIPGIATAMPRPGPWMDKLKAVLSLALIGTGIWLLTVLDSIVGREVTLSIGGMAALILVIFATRRWLPEARIARMAPAAAVILSAAALILPLTRDAISNAPSVAAVTDANWVPFDEAAISTHVAAGRTVFVDVTADWCITCQFNKKSVVEADPVASWLAQPDVIAMRADWTRPSEVISQYLNKHGRYGIPFNIVYGPDAPQGVALPELLTTDSVVEAAAQSNGNLLVAED